ncbi:MAG: ATP-binding protein, partial [Candidatus Dadabacteria bacterium]|nr:ATP-binding protein [Candidatus Dadabacteria bacterium]
MKLIKFRIQNYKSIRDSGWCYLASDITILAGQNESGKTAVLEALRDFNQTASVSPDSFPVDSNT